MSVNRIADRYAKSLLDLAIEGGKTERVLEDILSFKKMLASKDLVNLLKSPIVNASKKSSIFNSLFTGKFDELTLTFIEVILRKGREQFLPIIALRFIEQYKAYKGITEVRLTTASKVSDHIIDEVKNTLQKEGTNMTNLEISTKVDERIIGGFIIEIGDNLYNNSVSYKLNELKKQFAIK